VTKENDSRLPKNDLFTKGEHLYTEPLKRKYFAREMRRREAKKENCVS
jgi:hypothetical protein